ncbi:hypothetical protein GCM10022402_42080 [Salinactinospora qingdaonensis]|uniref:Uncharacterized protein n=1 Tax=Salinactinospora qingdaonensis TaxID=702744 RepID=A0ABP7GG46_9ACTN
MRAKPRGEALHENGLFLVGMGGGQPDRLSGRARWVRRKGHWMFASLRELGGEDMAARTPRGAVHSVVTVKDSRVTRSDPSSRSPLVNGCVGFRDQLATV